jgi:hypothetical protein
MQRATAWVRYVRTPEQGRLGNIFVLKVHERDLVTKRQSASHEPARQTCDGRGCHVVGIGRDA